MAQMYPAFFDIDVKSSAEQRLYDALARELDDQWIVFHHVKWIGVDERGRPCDGETDFVIAHPQLGVLVIEVKGGRIRFDSDTRRYITTDRDGQDHDIGDPLEQAMKSKKNLLKKVRRMRNWPRSRVIFGHAVAFPGVVIPPAGLQPNAPKDVIIDSIDLISLEQKLRKVYAFWNSASLDTPPGNVGIKALFDALYQPGQIRNPLLAESIRSDEQTLIQLTEKQLGYLRFLQSHRRAAIGGCAGSGKTFLAVEKARQMAENEQQKVLFTCYNQGLAYHISEELGYRKLFDVYDFHQLCINWAKEAGIGTASQSATSPDYFDRILPDQLMDAIEILGSRYDAIVVDEGQDFRDQWWDTLQWLLHEPESGSLYIFFDDNQRVYRDRSPIPIAQAPYHLDENCRNTQRIAGVVNQFYTGERHPKSLGPQGQPVEVIPYSNDSQEKNELRRLLHRLIANNGFHHDQIAILSAQGTQGSSVLGQRLGNVQLTDRLPLTSGEIFATTIRRFKGLESTVIVLCEVDGNISPTDMDALMYVGTSRAKAYLIILLRENASSAVWKILEPYKAHTG